MTSDEIEVLVVDDETRMADMYTDYLSDNYRVKTAYGGGSALDLVDEDTDVVFLDRRMPHPTGDEVLEEIRSRDLDCHVAMLTAVEPGFDIIEMEFDDYVIKPVSADDLIEIVERFQSQTDYDQQVRRHLSLVAKRNVIQSNMDEGELASNARFQELEQAIETSRSQLDSGVSGDILVEFLLQETGNRLYTVLQYDEDEWEYKYVSASGEELVAELDDRIDEVIDGFRREGRQMGLLGEVFDEANHYCTLHLFGGLALINFSQADGRGILCGFDPAAASHLTEFVELILPYIRQSGLGEIDAEPTWISY